jgi:hypothetical protein
MMLIELQQALSLRLGPILLPPQQYFLGNLFDQFFLNSLLSPLHMN